MSEGSRRRSRGSDPCRGTRRSSRCWAGGQTGSAHAQKGNHKVKSSNTYKQHFPLAGGGLVGTRGGGHRPSSERLATPLRRTATHAISSVSYRIPSPSTDSPELDILGSLGPAGRRTSTTRTQSRPRSSSPSVRSSTTASRIPRWSRQRVISGCDSKRRKLLIRERVAQFERGRGRGRSSGRRRRGAIEVERLGGSASLSGDDRFLVALHRGKTPRRDGPDESRGRRERGKLELGRVRPLCVILLPTNFARFFAVGCCLECAIFRFTLSTHVQGLTASPHLYAARASQPLRSVMSNHPRRRAHLLARGPPQQERIFPLSFALSGSHLSCLSVRKNVSMAPVPG
jgi:hypothetical protein